MNIFEDLGRRLRGWPALFLGPAIAVLLGLLLFRYSDWIFLALIAGLWVSQIYVFWYVRRIEKKLDGDAGGLSLPKPTEEILFILGKLAETECEYVRKEVLLKSYEAHFKDRNADEFAAVFRVLKGAYFIRFYCQESDKPYISEKGSAYYLSHKKRKK